MAVNIKSFVVDKVRRGVGFSRTDGSMIFNLVEISDPTLSNTAENKQAIGADGAPIMTLYNAKNATFSATSALLELDLMAAQLGTELEAGSADNKITYPEFKEYVITEDNQAEITLDYVPVGTAGAEIPFIYVTKVGGVAQRIKLGEATGADAFVLDAAAKKITLPTGLKKGQVVLVNYEYEAASGTRLVNSAKKFPSAFKFVLDVLGHDLCNKDILYAAKVVFPNAQLSPNFDVALATDGKHPFELEAMQEYCDSEKLLYYILVPDGVTE